MYVYIYTVYVQIVNRDLSVAKVDLPIYNKMGRSAFATDKSILGISIVISAIMQLVIPNLFN